MVFRTFRPEGMFVPQAVPEAAPEALAHGRPHQALGYRTPAEVFYGEPVEEEEDLKERRCSDQPVLVSCGGVQESHLIVA